MKSGNYKLTEIASNEMLDYAQYVMTSRAIPSMIDGQKPVQRFYIFSSITNSPKDFKKVSAVSGVVSDYGYNHGEMSAASAGQLMAATWSNNICLVEGRGSFGTRQVPTAGAARYVYTRLHSNFSKYITDLELSPEHSDPEHQPPQYYLPVIPLVLVNGAKGIATGFATNILPHNPNDIIAGIREYIQSGKITTELRIKFPDFSGTTYFDPVLDRVICEGTWRKVKKTTLLIDEIPYGFDREDYIKILDKLEDEGLILGYIDKCNSNGFQFEVKLKQQTSAKWSNNELIKNFKLAKKHSENITVIDQNNNLREYTNAKDLVVDFIDFRLTVLANRIKLAQAQTNEELRWLTVKIQFIQAVVDNKIKFKGCNKANVISQINGVTDALQCDLMRLLALNILSLTKEQITALEKQIKACQKELRYWKKTTPKKQYIEDLDNLEK